MVKLFDHELTEVLNVGHAVSKRWKHDGHDIESIVKIGAKSLLLHHFFKSLFVAEMTRTSIGISS